MISYLYVLVLNSHISCVPVAGKTRIGAVFSEKPGASFDLANAWRHTIATAIAPYELKLTY